MWLIKKYKKKYYKFLKLKKRNEYKRKIDFWVKKASVKRDLLLLTCLTNLNPSNQFLQMSYTRV